MIRTSKQYQQATGLELLTRLLWSGIEDGKAQNTTKARDKEQRLCFTEILNRLGEDHTQEEIDKAIQG